MDSTTVCTVVGGLLVLSVIILTSLCLYCKGNSQQKKITQPYNPHPNQMNHGTTFTVIRPFTDNACSNTLSPVDQPHFITSPSVHGSNRRSPCPSPDGSQSDYVNEEDGNGYELPPDSDKNNDYLDVLPDETRVSQPSLASSTNSGQNYENVRPEEKSISDDDDSDSQQYMNVKDNKEIISQTPIGSFGSCSSDGQDSSDYVNAPQQVTIHLG
ncbi:linker for activation of T-cells family member 1 [Electrophorus electricus]|uniref:linker for activation of T-cells family member 1 n=1 Tax=Electrophorus electricus TaxID=8005 RepID=UPI0015D0CB83|nr:linker for activation of T-cells family member 1 [Electrophorus electricus]